jgi:tetratricopeptide (TPR) repeat protein
MKAWARLILCAALAPMPAFAAPPNERSASDLKHEADASFDAGRYAEAAEGYARAYEMKPDATLLYNEARALEAMGEYPDALARLERFASTAPPEIRAKVPSLETLVADLRAHITSITVHTNAPNARLLVRGKDYGEVTEWAPVRVRAGAATLRLVAEGYRDEERTVELRGGTVYELRVTLAKREVTGGSPPLRETPRAPTSAASPITSRWWFWSGVAVLLGAAAATTILLVSEDDPASGTFTPGRISAGLVTF